MPETDLPEAESVADLSFEEAMDELESLVRGVDSNRLPLNEMITGYERGTKLYKVCKQRLDEARGRIEMIRKRNAEEDAILEEYDKTAAENAQQSIQKQQATVSDSSDESAEDVDQEPTLKDGELF